MEKPDLRGILLDLLKRPTERDKQVKVGASNFSQPCPRCLAEQLLSKEPDTSDRPYWAGAVLGTATHAYIESRVREFFPDWMPEKRLTLGELPGYGVIKSTSDLYVPEFKLAVDWKTTTKAKLVFIKEALKNEPNEFEISDIAQARYKVVSYLNQLMSYGRGMVLAGYPVEWVGLGFVCRDAVGDKDIWAHVVPYDAEQADHVWDRLERLWAWLQAGNDPDTLPSAPGCYRCERER